MENILVFFSDNYADEFDVDGHTVMTRKEYQKVVDYINKYFETKGRDYEWYFGSNESITYRNAKEFLGNFSVTPISDEDLEIVAKYGLDGSGQSPLDWILDDIEEEEEE